jgi:hypothetical protein
LPAERARIAAFPVAECYQHADQGRDQVITGALSKITLGSLAACATCALITRRVPAGDTEPPQALVSKGLRCGVGASGEQVPYVREVMVVPRRISVRALECRGVESSL